MPSDENQFTYNGPALTAQLLPPRMSITIMSGGGREAIQLRETDEGRLEIEVSGLITPTEAARLFVDELLKLQGCRIEHNAVL